MSFYAIVDVCIHFHSFQNIDLFYQGIYQLEARVYCYLNQYNTTIGVDRKPIFTSGSNHPVSSLRNHNQCIAGIPYGFVSGRSENILQSKLYENGWHGGGKVYEKKKHQDSLERYGPALDTQQQTFTSSPFVISDVDEKVSLNELCQFRLELDLCCAGALTAPVYLEVDLLYKHSEKNEDIVECSTTCCKTPERVFSVNPTRSCETLSISIPVHELSVNEETNQYDLFHKSDASNFMHETCDHSCQFESVSFQVFQLHNACKGIHQFLPITFDALHYSVCNTLVHTSLINIRQHMRSQMVPCFYRPRFQDKKPEPSLELNHWKEKKKAEEKHFVESALEKDTKALLEEKNYFGEFLKKGHKGLFGFVCSLVSTKLTLRSSSLTNLHENRKAWEPAYETKHSQSDFMEEIGTTSESEIKEHDCAQAQDLHTDYCGVMLECFCQRYMFARSVYYHLWIQKQEKINDKILHFNSINLPGGDVIILPGVYDKTIWNTSGTKKLLESKVNPFLEIRNECTGASLHKDTPSIGITLCLPKKIVQFELHLIQHAHGNKHPTVLKDLNKTLCLTLHATMPCILINGLSNHIESLQSTLKHDFGMIGSQLMGFWQHMIDSLFLLHSESLNMLQSQYKEMHNDFWKECIIRETLPKNYIMDPKDKCLPDLHQNVVDHLRKSMQMLDYQYTLITDVHLCPTLRSRPLIFEQRYSSKPTKESTTSKTSSLSSCYKGSHLLVLVHGYQGNAYDMQLLRNTLKQLYPSIILLCSSINEISTEGCIGEMGIRLADEIMQFIKHHNLTQFLSRLSFVAHSLGGIIVRAALPYLKMYQSNFYTFLTLSTPHLGYLYSFNRLLETGIWVLKKWKKCKALQQLTLSDTKDVRQCYLYTLAMQSQPFQHFRHVALISSHQDHYVTFESARIEMSGRAEKNIKLSIIYREMIENILQWVSPEALRRFNVNFSLSEKTFENYIGRTAHIQFLEDSAFMQMFFESYSEMFQ